MAFPKGCLREAYVDWTEGAWAGSACAGPLGHGGDLMTKWGGQPGGGGHCGSAGPCSTWVRTWVCALAGVPDRPHPRLAPRLRAPRLPSAGAAGASTGAHPGSWARSARDSSVEQAGQRQCPRPLPPSASGGHSRGWQGLLRMMTAVRKPLVDTRVRPYVRPFGAVPVWSDVRGPSIAGGPCVALHPTSCPFRPLPPPPR